MLQVRFAWVTLALAIALPLATYAQTVPAGTAIVVTLDQSVSSKDAKAGDTVAASVAHNVEVHGHTVIPKGAKVNLTIASAQASGRLSTPAKLWLKLNSIELNGRDCEASAHWSGQTGPSHAKRNAVAIGGGSVAGALIGGLAGGGKGAAIGAGAGAGAGTAGAAATGKKDIEFPAESNRTFTLKTDLVIR